MPQATKKIKIIISRLAAQAQAVAEASRRDAEADDVGKRIQLLAEGRVLAAPARHFAIGDVEQ